MPKPQLAPQKPRRAPLLKRIIKVALIVIVLLALMPVVLYYRWTRAPLPELDGEVRLSGLSAPVTVARDQWGVPHISAATIEDAIFAQGYVMAQDRLWQMDLLRRAAKGELSEVLGAGDDNARLELDKLHRNLGLHRAAQRTWPLLSAELRGLVEAYARGVNAYIESHRDRLPLEFRLLRYEPAAWQATDSLAIGKLMGLSLTGTWKFDLMRADLSRTLDPQLYKLLFDERTAYDRHIYGEDKPAATEAPVRASAPFIKEELFASARAPIGADFLLDTHTAMLGSNNWVLAGTRTATGKPILANDPHQGLTLPSIWHQIHLRATDGSYHVAGVSLIGGPGIVIGHNERIAWGATNFMADVQDLYVEEFDPQNPTRYRVGDEWREAEVIKEQIRVRLSPVQTETRTIEHEIVITRHGPIVATAQGQKLALRWAGSDNESEFPAMFEMNRARNWTEFCEALRRYPVPILNIVYADVEGNIGYYGIGHIPVRASGDGSLPYNGRTGEGEWLRYVPFEEMPHIYNPASGFVQTANQRITGTAYPYTMSHDWAPPYRAHRIDQVLSTGQKFSMADMHTLQADVYTAPTHLFVEQALKMAEAHGEEAVWRELKEELKAFDGHLRADSRAGAIAARLRHEFTEKFFNYWLGDKRPVYQWYRRSGVIDNVITERPAAWLPKPYQSYDEMVIDCYRSAVKTLTESLGGARERWHYGAINQIYLAHPMAPITEQSSGMAALLQRIFNPAPLPAGGSPHSVNAIDTNPKRMWGPSMRMVVSMADLDVTTLTLMPGQSGQQASRFYTDQLADWQVVRPHPFPFSDSGAAAIAQHRLQLLPAR